MNLSFDLKRFEDQVKRIESYPVYKNRVILYGSSFFTCWGYESSQKALAHLLPEYEISTLNHGFGGSVCEEQLYFYRRLIVPYEPRAVVIRAGFNDIMSHGLPGGETAQQTIRLLEWIKTDFPSAKRIIIPIFDTPSIKERKDETVKKIREYNSLIVSYANSENTAYVMAIDRFIYSPDARIGAFEGMRDIFRDGTHLTDEAYGEFNDFFKTVLTEILSK